MYLSEKDIKTVSLIAVGKKWHKTGNPAKDALFKSLVHDFNKEELQVVVKFIEAQREANSETYYSKK